MVTGYDIDEMLGRLRQACEEAGSHRQWAIARGIDPIRVTQALVRREAPAPAILQALGLERVTVYRKVIARQE